MNPTTQEVHYAGVDVSKGHLDVFVRPAGEHFGVPNDHAGIGSLVCRLHEGARPALVVLEATGGFERPVAAAFFGHRGGLAVAVVNPRQARDFARATGRLAKTERIDAEVLAHFAEAVHPTPRPAFPTRKPGLVGGDSGPSAPTGLWGCSPLRRTAWARPPRGRCAGESRRMCGGWKLGALSHRSGPRGGDRREPDLA